MSNLPKIQELINGKLALVLGAGSALDYGFPTWNGLQEMLLKKIDDQGHPSGLDGEIKWEWMEILQKADFSRTTIDHVIANNYGNLVRRHWVVNLIKEVISDCEKKDRATARAYRWIDRLSFELCSTLKEYEASGDDQAVLDLLNGLRIVSLNYDRSFAYYFFPPIVQFFHKAKLSDPDFLRTKQNDLVGFFRTYQPHGSLGFLSVEDMARTGNPISAVTVVDGNRYSNFNPNSNGTEYGGNHSVNNHIELVGESDMKGNYKAINQEVLAGCKYCLVIGLSDVGIEGCGIDWSIFDTVFYSGATLPPGIGGNFQCLNMYADEIAQNLCSQKTPTDNEWVQRIIHHAS